MEIRLENHNFYEITPFLFQAVILLCIVFLLEHPLILGRYRGESMVLCGPGSVVGIATVYGLGGPEIEFRWGEIFRTSPDRLLGPPSLQFSVYRG